MLLLARGVRHTLKFVPLLLAASIFAFLFLPSDVSVRGVDEHGVIEELSLFVLMVLGMWLRVVWTALQNRRARSRVGHSGPSTKPRFDLLDFVIPVLLSILFSTA